MRAPFASARRLLLGGALTLLLPGCIDSYSPDVITAPRSYLVVDGFINTQGVSTIKLSRTFAIAAKPQPAAEVKATVYIEEETGPRYPLQEGVGGTYTSQNLLLTPGQNYRLHLTTTGGQEYTSDYVPAKTTPPIDEVKWQAEDAQLGIYVSAHDETKATQYYRWDYEETWEIRPIYQPPIEYVNDAIRDIVVPFPTICWGSATSTAIQIDKATALSQNLVANYQIRLLASTSELLFSRYSILVRQYALTKEEYGYWELLRKNTESIGTLFDPQPVQLTGNIHCLSDETELALGFVGAHSVAEKRIFINRAELPRTWNVSNGYESCVPPDNVDLYPGGSNPPSPAEILHTAFSGPNYLPIYPYASGNVPLAGYLGASRDCIDCRTRGTATKPSFW